MDCTELVETLRAGLIGALAPFDTFLIAILAALIDGVGTFRNELSRDGRSAGALTAVGDEPVIQSGCSLGVQGFEGRFGFGTKSLLGA